LAVPPKASRSTELERVSVTASPLPVSDRAVTQEKVPARKREPFKLQFDVLRKAEFWLNKVGIVLFLFGVVFLFRYAMDKGWLNEQARVGTGLLLGSMLLGFGMLLHRERQHLAQVLLGGAIATYYITGYAAYNIFPTLNVPYETALAYMAVVTALAFLLSLWHGEAVLALIGVVGGLATPFALGTDQVQVPGLIMYTALILVGTSAIYLRRGWRAVLVCAFTGGAANLLLGHALAWESWGYAWWKQGAATFGDRAYLQAGIIVVLLTFWLVPIVRRVLWRKDPARWPVPTLDASKYPGLSELAGVEAHLLSALVPLLCLVGSWGLWLDIWVEGPPLISWETWGVVSLVGAAVMLGAFLLLHRVERSLAYVHALLATALLTLSIVQLLDGDAIFLAFAVEALGLQLIARRFADKGIELWAHALFSVVGMWLVPRLAGGLDDMSPFYNSRALLDLVVLGLGMAASFALARPETRVVYRSLFHLAAMALFWRELHALTNGEGLTMLAWAGYALALHVIATRITDKANAAATTIAAHFALDAALGVLAYRLATGLEGSSPILNGKAGIDLLFMGLAFGTSFLVKPKGVATVYRVLVHLAALGWLLRESTWADVDHGYVMLRWALYLGMLAVVSHRLRDKAMLVFVNCAWVGVGSLFVFGLTSPRGEAMPFLNAGALVGLAVIGITFALQLVAHPRWTAVAYRVAAHAGVFCLLWRELVTLPQGQEIVMVSWAAYGLGVLLLSARLRDEITAQVCNVAFLGVGMLLGASLLRQPEGVAFANWVALLDIAAIALGAAASFLCRPSEAALGYRLSIHCAVLLLMFRELFQLESGMYMVMFGWAAYATCLYFLGRRVRDEATLWSGYAVLGASGGWLLLRVIYGLVTVNPDAPAVFTVRGVAELGVIALAAAIFPLVRNGKLRLAHGLWLYLAFLGWMWQELGLLEDGNAYVTIGWGLYGIALVVGGFLLSRNLPVMLCGVTTLFTIAGKLFVVDLQYLGTGWQIALFLGFGAFFLVVSYGFQRYVLGRGGPAEGEGSPARGDILGRQAPENG
jgi:hypothetical protein